MKPRSSWDVVVVGGGPAGAAAAGTAAAAGMAVLVLDGAPPGRCRPGETLHPGVDIVFDRLGARDAVARAGWLRPAGQWAQWGAPMRFEAFGADAGGPWRGYQAPRAELDRLLLDRAAAAGATVRRGCTAVAPTVTGNRVDGVLTAEGPVAAHWVVDASGRRHWSARRLGSPVHRVSSRLIASWGHLSAAPGGEDREPLLRGDDEGWTWTARVGRGRWAWVRLDATGRGRLRTAPDDAATTGPHGADVTWRRAAVTAAPGLLVAGDAAGVLDPASGSGVLRALVSGAVAASSLVEVAAGRADESAVAAGYRRWLADWFAADVRRLDRLYGLLPCWPGLRAAEPITPRTAGAPDRARPAAPAR